MFFQQLETKPPNYFPRMCVERVTPCPYILAVTPNIVDEVRWGKNLTMRLENSSNVSSPPDPLLVAVRLSPSLVQWRLLRI